MKIITVIGARPQFIKASMGSRQIRKEHEEIIIHTGQHFDDNMSDSFFRELDIPTPDYYLNISGGNHSKMTGKMLIAIDKVLEKELADALLVYGDTNSTLAASLAAVKRNIPIFHVEAGNRLGTLDNPEEVNRKLTDHCATLNFCATETAYNHLVKEGLERSAHLVGNIMLDSFLYYSKKKWNKSTIETLDGSFHDIPKKYYYMTCHRQENTSSDQPLTEILAAMDSLSFPTIYPVHPRNTERALRICKKNSFSKIILAKPIGYQDSIHLTKRALKIVTDSGGLQCEAFFAEVQCVFVFDYIVWPETMVNNRNQLAKADRDDILLKLSRKQIIDPNYKPFGEGNTAENICKIIRDWR